MKKLAGRTAIITGASQGLGLAIARAYVIEGAHVTVCATSEGRIKEVGDELRSLATDQQSVLAMQADVTDEKAARSVVNRTASETGRIDILVNNAGIYGPKGPTEDVSWEEWKQAIEVNLFGSVLFARMVLPHMRDQRYGKIVQVSGGGATKPMPRVSAYAASKAAVVRFAETLAEETRGAGIDVNSLAPGALNTRMLDEILAAGPERVGRSFYEGALAQKESGGAPPERAASLAVYLGSAESDGITGKLVSAVWDPWEELGSHREDLESDIYTLRRIVPDDRGRNWGS